MTSTAQKKTSGTGVRGRPGVSHPQPPPGVVSTPPSDTPASATMEGGATSGLPSIVARGRKGGSSALHIQDRVSIAERPAAVEDRSVAGNWEADLMMFTRYGQALLALHERSSRLLIVGRSNGKHAEPIADAIASLLGPLPQSLRQTITFDNGTEFARHYELHRLDIQTFFCDPYAPWQKGGVENAIGRLRRNIPRKTNLDTLTTRQLSNLVRAYNNTPRKCLDWHSPAEIFCSQVLHLECESISPLSRG